MFVNNELTRKIMQLHSNVEDLIYVCKSVYDCGKLIIAFESESNNLIDKDVILAEINAICLPYFDTTYDDIDIIHT
mgnify:FL=1